MRGEPVAKSEGTAEKLVTLLHRTVVKLFTPLYWMVVKLFTPSALILAISYWSFYPIALSLWVNAILLLFLLAFMDVVISILVSIFRPSGILFPSLQEESKHKLWLQTQTSFAILSVLDLLAIFLALYGSYRISGSATQTVLGLVTLYTIIYFLSIFWRYSFLKMLGTGYERMRCFSMIGAAALANLATKMLISRDKMGIKYLSYSLKMVYELLKGRDTYLPPLGNALIAVDAIEEASDNSYWEELEFLSAALSKLPNLEKLSVSVENFNAKVKWALSFKPLVPRPVRIGLLNQVGAIATILGGIATFLTGLPEPSRLILYGNLLSSGVFLAIPAALLGGWSLVLLNDLQKSPRLSELRNFWKN